MASPEIHLITYCPFTVLPLLAASWPSCQSVFAMELSGALLQFLGSLVAILLLAGLALWLKLGQPEPFADEASVQHAADEVEHGFRAVESAIGRDGHAALARDAGGRVMLLRTHGNKVAGRLLGPAARARQDGDALIIHSGERFFGEVRLVIANSSVWADAIGAISRSAHA